MGFCGDTSKSKEVFVFIARFYPWFRSSRMLASKSTVCRYFLQKDTCSDGGPDCC